MNAYKYIISALAFLMVLSTNAQQALTSVSASSLKRYAQAAAREGDYKSGINYWEAYLKRKPKDQKAKYELAEQYAKNRNYQKANDLFRELDPTEFPLAPFYQGEMEIRLGRYQEAQMTLSDFRKSYRGEKNDDYYRRLAKDKIESAEAADTISQRKSKYTVKRLNGDVNKVYIEQSPLLIDEELLIYTSLRSDTFISVTTNETQQPTKRTFHSAQKDGTTWKYVGVYELHPFFTDFDLSSACLSPNGNRMIVSACQVDLSDKMICRLYSLQKSGDTWINPTLLPEEVNARGVSTTQPTLAPGSKNDREILYFVSERPDGRGGKDIWYSTYYTEKKTYRAARNAGMKINTNQDELSPYYDLASAQLYFSSEGHPGLGGFDLYTTQGYKGKWEEPENIGPPINSAADELFYSPSNSGIDGFFTSNRAGGEADNKETCCDDLYQFKKIDSAYTLLEGKVQFADNSSTPIWVEVYITTDDGDKLFVKRILTDQDGNYSTRLLPGKRYEVSTSSDGALAKLFAIDLLKAFDQQRINWSPKLQPINDQPFVIKDINYEFDKDELTSIAKLKLDSFLLPVMINNPSLIIEIGSHTDNRGTSAYNYNLSQRRAESIVKYMIKKGINPNRLTAKGYGESKPIAKNENSDGTDNAEGRAINRRSEIKVIGRIEVEEED